MSQVDLTITNQIISAFNATHNLNASGEYNSPDIVQQSTNDVYGADDIAVLGFSFLFDQISTLFQKDTQKHIVLNDLSNNNGYIAESLKKETEKFDDIGEKTNNNIHKTRSKFFEKQWTIGYNKFIRYIIIWFFILSIPFFIALSYLMKDKINKQLFYIVLTLVVVFSAFVILLYFKNLQNKRRDDWSKWYFSSMGSQTSYNRNGTEFCESEH